MGLALGADGEVGDGDGLARAGAGGVAVGGAGRRSDAGAVCEAREVARELSPDVQERVVVRGAPVRREADAGDGLGRRRERNGGG